MADHVDRHARLGAWVLITESWHYWDANCCDELPPQLALLVFDADVNNGPGRGAKWLQMTVDATVDGRIGPKTLQAVTATLAKDGGAAVMAEFMAQRLVFMASLSAWKADGLGWSRRLCLLPYQAMQMATS